MASHHVYDSPIVIVTVLLSIGLLSTIGILIYLLTRPKDSNNTDFLLLKQQLEHMKENVDVSSKLIHQQMSELRTSMEEGSRASTKVLGERLDNAARVVGEVQKSLGRMEEQTKQIFDVGKDISKLNEILKSPKLRGSLGELFLGDLLAQVLPKDQFELQYAFKSGQKVDAIIRSAHGLIPIDSKFPLENFVKILQIQDEEEKKSTRKLFLQDVKKHVDAIAQKYILPDEGTMDFALMYIPAENVYYEIILKHEATEKDLLRYAQEKRVFPVSPNSFYAYLQTLSIGFKGMQLQAGIRSVLDNISRLKFDFRKFGEDFVLLGKHLSNARGSYESVDKRMQRFGEKLETLELEDQQGLRVLTGGTAGDPM